MKDSYQILTLESFFNNKQYSYSNKRLTPAFILFSSSKQPLREEKLYNSSSSLPECHYKSSPHSLKK